MSPVIGIRQDVLNKQKSFPAGIFALDPCAGGIGIETHVFQKGCVKFPVPENQEQGAQDPFVLDQPVHSLPGKCPLLALAIVMKIVPAFAAAKAGFRFSGVKGLFSYTSLPFAIL